MVKVYYDKDTNLTVSYSDKYGSPYYHDSEVEFDDVNVAVGDKINFKANSGYEIKEIRIKQSDKYGTPFNDFVATPNSDRYSVTISADMLPRDKITLSFIVEAIYVEPEVVTLNIDLSGSENVTTSLDNLATIEYTMGALFEFTANANDGYEFTGANGEVTLIDKHGTPITPSLSIDGTGEMIQFSVILDRVANGWTIKINLSPDYVDISDVNTFINLYRTNQGELNLLSSKRYGYVNEEFVDYGERITNLFRLPIHIPEAMIIPDESIKLGNYDTEVKSSLIKNYTMHIEVDRISVPEIYGNSLDYAGVVCELFLPFISSIELPADFVINQEVTIKYVLNLLSGDVTVNLYSSKTEELFKTYNEQIAMSLPFVQGVSINNPIGQVQTVSLNENRLAYIQVTRNKMANENDVGFSVDITGRLADYTGYVEVENIRLNSNATLGEITEIKNTLRSGVFINE